MTDVETLQECRMAAMEERAISRQIERLAMIGGPRGVGSQAMEPAGDRKTNNATAAHLQKLDGLIDKLVKMRDENVDIMLRAEEVIEKVKDHRERVIIRCYYVEGESDYEIAAQMELTAQRIQQVRNKTIEGLNVKNKKHIGKLY